MELKEIVKTEPVDMREIPVEYKKSLVQISCDDTLRSFLKSDKRAAVDLAEYIKTQYMENRKKELDITTDSLAIEILGHVYADALAEAMQHIGHMPEGLKYMLEELGKKAQEKTRIIDCGETSVDPNRFVWDALEKLNVGDVIFEMAWKMHDKM